MPPGGLRADGGLASSRLVARRHPRRIPRGRSGLRVAQADRRILPANVGSGWKILLSGWLGHPPKATYPTFYCAGPAPAIARMRSPRLGVSREKSNSGDARLTRACCLSPRNAALARRVTSSGEDTAN